MEFTALGLSERFLPALQAAGLTAPRPVQAAALPPLLAGRDALIRAQTGSGKTAAFVLPLLQRLAEQLAPAGPSPVRLLILVPTRELAGQVQSVVDRLGEGLSLTSLAVYGGVPLAPQVAALAAGIDVLVATPGRLVELIEQSALRLNKVQAVVLDEADRLLDLGFAPALETLFAALPRRHQLVLVSATYPPAIRQLAGRRLRQPATVDVSASPAARPKIRQWVVPVDKKRKPGLLLHLLRDRAWTQVLVFVRTRAGADQLVDYLRSKDLRVAALHGDRAQAEREQVLGDFRAGALQVLVATDVAARGLDIGGLPAVVNVDLPATPTDYEHRIGRTGRAGARGEAVSLVCADEAPALAAIERHLRQPLSRDEEPGFEPVHAVPWTSGPAARVKAAPPRRPGPARPGPAKTRSATPPRRRSPR